MTESKYYYIFISETTRLWDYSRCYVIKYNWTNTSAIIFR